MIPTGTLLGPYKVVGSLGAGGMGEVYLAEDVRLGRRVAVKVLAERLGSDPDRLRRFEQEARTVSLLNHPNILTIHDVGAADALRFIATEFVDGETLRARLARGRLAPADAIDVALQVAGALAAAHDAGIVHRDLKPENVMIRRDGYVKVLDFGLAKLMDTGQVAGLDASEPLHTTTSPGVVMGTTAYMSPEQARGQAVDHRSDLFALGVVLYEMLTGSRPFSGATMIDQMISLVSSEPPRVSRAAPVSPGVDRFVEKSLRKQPTDRYQSAAEMMRELRGLGRKADLGRMSPSRPQTPPSAAPVAAEIKTEPPKRGASVDSVAVLPLTNVNQDAELDYLSDGLTDSLINNLSLVPGLRVLARSTVFRYKGQPIDPIAVGKELGVQSVLTGRVSRRGEHLVVGAELVNVGEGTQLWGSQITRPASDVFTLQDDISREISEALKQRFSPSEVPTRPPAHAPKAGAYELYLKGTYFLNKRGNAAIRRAIEWFKQAEEADPGFAPVHAGLADCHALLATYSSAPELIAEATRSAYHALELDETLAQAHASLAFIKARFDLDWAGAELEFRRALDLNPNLAITRLWYAMFLASRRGLDEAMAEMERARQLDPSSLVVQCGIGRIHHFAGRYAEAEAEFERILKLDPSFVRARIDLTMTLIASGRYRAARERIAQTDWSTAEGFRDLFIGMAAGMEGDHETARAMLELQRERHRQGLIGADQIAPLAIVLGEMDEAYQLLVEAVQTKSALLSSVKVEPIAKMFLTVPGVPELFRKHGLID